MLALGSIGTTAFFNLRRRIMGSVVTNGAIAPLSSRPGSTVQRTLEAIEGHHTKAASTYYARYFSNYFRDLSLSIDQLVRAVPSGKIVLVVQNSYFKNIEIDLRAIVTEQLHDGGFPLISSWEHPVKAPIAGSNPRFRMYRESNVKFESVLVFSNS